MSEGNKMKPILDSNFLEMRYQRKKQERLDVIFIHVDLIKKDFKSKNNHNYFIIILKEIGYLLLTELLLKDELHQKQWVDVLNVIESIESENGDTSTLVKSIIAFDDHFLQLEQLICAVENFIFPPKLELNSKAVKKWDIEFWKRRQNSIEVISKAFDMIVVQYAWETLQECHKKNPYSSNPWLLFSENVEKYIETIYKYKKIFYPFSNDIFKLAADFTKIPNETFQKFVFDTTEYRENSVKENYYSKILAYETVEEIYDHIKLKFQNFPSMALLYFYEIALAQHTLKEFILNLCFSKPKKYANRSSQYQLTSDIDFIDDTIFTTPPLPLLKAGNNKYSLHMYKRGKKQHGWGIRKDHFDNLISDVDFQGAIFCSMNEYPDGSIFICFENFIERKRFKYLLNCQKEEFENFIRLSFKDVYGTEDLREMFFETVSNAVIKIQEKTTPKSLQILEYFYNIISEYRYSLNISRKFTSAVATALVIFCLIFYGLYDKIYLPFIVPNFNNVNIISESEISSTNLTKFRSSDEDIVLYSGDRYSLIFETNRDAYVYAVFYDSMEKIDKASFGKRPGGKIHILSQGEEKIPFQLDFTTGIETVFLIASKEKIIQFDQKVEELKDAGIDRIDDIFPKTSIKILKYQHE